MLTRRQKYLALSVVPTADGDCTLAEVRKWRKELAGTVYRDVPCNMFIVLNRKGRRKQYEYCCGPRERAKTNCNCFGDYEAARKAAYRWATL